MMKGAVVRGCRNVPRYAITDVEQTPVGNAKGKRGHRETQVPYRKSCCLSVACILVVSTATYGEGKTITIVEGQVSGAEAA